MSDDFESRRYDPRIETETYCVRDIDDREPDLGVVDRSKATGASDLERRGIGFEFSDATDEIEDRLDLEEHVGETIATVVIDFDSDERYSIEWHVEKCLSERVREVLRL